MRITCPMKLKDFDNYDQALLLAALNAGRQFATIHNGPEGHWVSAVSSEDPYDGIDFGSPHHPDVIRLDAIAGLADSACLSAANR